MRRSVRAEERSQRHRARAFGAAYLHPVPNRWRPTAEHRTEAVHRILLGLGRLAPTCSQVVRSVADLQLAAAVAIIRSCADCLNVPVEAFVGRLIELQGLTNADDRTD